MLTVDVKLHYNSNTAAATLDVQKSSEKLRNIAFIGDFYQSEQFETRECYWQTIYTTEKLTVSAPDAVAKLRSIVVNGFKVESG